MQEAYCQEDNKVSQAAGNINSLGQGLDLKRHFDLEVKNSEVSQSFKSEGEKRGPFKDTMEFSLDPLQKSSRKTSKRMKILY